MGFDNERPVLSLDQKFSLRIGETGRGRGTGKKVSLRIRETARGYYKKGKYKIERTLNRETLFFFSRLHTHSILYAIQIINEIIQSKTQCCHD